MTGKLVCIVQARLNSSRLPGKVLKPLGDQSVLSHVIHRCRAIGGVDTVVVAAVDDPAEAPVAELAEALGAPVVKGPETDVLARYHQAADAHGADHIMRVTADCPILDPAICTDLVTIYHAHRPDHACLVGWPHGINCELFPRRVLDEMHRTATRPEEREHVTLWIARNRDRRRVRVRPRSTDNFTRRYRLTLDYAEDYAVLSRLAELMGPAFNTANCRDLVAMMNAYPDLAQLNAAVGRDWQKRTAAIYAAAADADSHADDAAMDDGLTEVAIEAP